LLARWTTAPAVDDWQRFGAARFRWYHLLALSSGIVAVMTGFDILIPFALAIGCPPAVTPLLGMLSLAGGMAPLLLPSLLRRADGNLRLLTMALSAIGETRGLVLALLVVLLAGGTLGTLPVLLLVIVIAGLSGVLGSMVSTNLLTWHSAVLAEPDRRLVVPRLMSISLAVGAVLLLPTALLMDGLVAKFGLIVYAVPFGIAGVFGLVEIVVQSRLPRPGRVRVPASALTADAPPPPQMGPFVRSSVVNAVGMGIAPYTSVYAIVVLGLTPGFTMAMGAVSLLTQVAASAWAGGRLTRGSSSRMLRSSFSVRALAMALPLLALPGLPIAPVLLMASVVCGAIGFVSGTLAANEKLFRMINGPAVLRQYGRFTAATSGAMTVGQLASMVALAAGGAFGYASYAGLYGASTGLRLLAHRIAAPPKPEMATAGASDAVAVALPHG
jgi:hypothetical protein